MARHCNADTRRFGPIRVDLGTDRRLAPNEEPRARLSVCAAVVPPSGGTLPAATSWRATVVMSRHVINGSRKNVPTVSTTVDGFSTSGTDHSGTRCSPAELTQASPALIMRLTTAVTISAFSTIQR